MKLNDIQGLGICVAVCLCVMAALFCLYSAMHYALVGGKLAAESAVESVLKPLSFGDLVVITESGLYGVVWWSGEKKAHIRVDHGPGTAPRYVDCYFLLSELSPRTEASK